MRSLGEITDSLAANLRHYQSDLTDLAQMNREMYENLSKRILYRLHRQEELSDWEKNSIGWCEKRFGSTIVQDQQEIICTSSQASLRSQEIAFQELVEVITKYNEWVDGNTKK